MVRFCFIYEEILFHVTKKDFKLFANYNCSTRKVFLKSRMTSDSKGKFIEPRYIVCYKV